MKTRKILASMVGLLFLALSFSCPILAQEEAAQKELPFWVKNWMDWAEKTGNKEWMAWGQRISDPRSVELGEAWREYLGFDCASMVAESMKTHCPDIKPGTVITKDNWKDYEASLKKLWPESLWKRITEGAYMPYAKLTIAPTQHLYCSRGVLHFTKEYEGKHKLDEQGMMKLGVDNYIAGIPFPKIPKVGSKEWDPKVHPWWVLHNMDRLVVGQDHLSFNPIIMMQYDKKGQPERTVKMGLYWRMYWNRMDLPPTPYIKGQENIESKGSISAIYPFDVRGFATTRWRYTEIDQPDYFASYLPAMRRVRRLSSADTQDPILGSELTFEDWKVWWQKISQKIWPSECKILREEEILIPLKWDKRFDIEEPGIIHTYFERRPSWLMDYVAIPPSTYFYQVRRSWHDFEEKRVNYNECYDVRGNLWRTWLDFNRWFPETGMWTWWGCDIPDHYNKHRTILTMEAQVNDPKLTDDYFDLRFLSALAH